MTGSIFDGLSSGEVERLAREVPAFGEALRNAAARPAR